MRIYRGGSPLTVSHPDHETKSHVIAVPLREGGPPQIVKEVDVNALAHIRLMVVENQEPSLARRHQWGVQRFKREVSLSVAITDFPRHGMQVQAAVCNDIMR